MGCNLHGLGPLPGCMSWWASTVGNPSSVAAEFTRVSLWKQTVSQTERFRLTDKPEVPFNCSQRDLGGLKEHSAEKVILNKFIKKLGHRKSQSILYVERPSNHLSGTKFIVLLYSAFKEGPTNATEDTEHTPCSWCH